MLVFGLPMHLITTAVNYPGYLPEDPYNDAIIAGGAGGGVLLFIGGSAQFLYYIIL